MASVLTVFAATLIGGAMALPAAAAMPASTSIRSSVTGAKVGMKSAVTPPSMNVAALREMDGDTAHPFNARTAKADNHREAAITAQLNAKEAQMAEAANNAAHVR